MIVLLIVILVEVKLLMVVIILVLVVLLLVIILVVVILVSVVVEVHRGRGVGHVNGGPRHGGRGVADGVPVPGGEEARAAVGVAVAVGAVDRTLGGRRVGRDVARLHHVNGGSRGGPRAEGAGGPGAPSLVRVHETFALERARWITSSALCGSTAQTEEPRRGPTASEAAGGPRRRRPSGGASPRPPERRRARVRSGFEPSLRIMTRNSKNATACLPARSGNFAPRPTSAPLSDHRKLNSAEQLE